jgi:MoaA/NifB/PqqE/SkfB family radical SAM enzyme
MDHKIVNDRTRYNLDEMTLRRIYRDLITLQGIFWQRRPWCGPRVAQINISENCNLDCVICNRSSMGVSGLLDEDRVIALADELCALGTQEIFFHGFGEPGCHPRLPDMIHHIHSRNPELDQHLITNGTWNSPRLRNAIIHGRVNTRFSLHAGDAETWQRMHPHDDLKNFARASDNLRYLTAGAPERVEVLYVICKLNCRTIPEMVSYALDHAVKRILFRPMRLYKDRNGQYMNATLLPNAEEYREAAIAIARFQEELRGRISMQSPSFEQSFYDPEQGRPSSRDFYLSRSCYIGYVLTVIERDGSVWGCLPESSQGEPMGNIQMASFREIWYGQKYASFRKKQLFADKATLDHSGCHSYCQHLETNVRLNRIRFRRKSLRSSETGALS